MKRTLLFLVLLIGIIPYQFSYAQNFTVATCSSNVDNMTYSAMRSSTTANDKNRTAFIIPASQLTAMAGGNITSTYFRRATATGSLNADTTFKIYLKNTAAVDFGATSPDWATETSTATLVYDSNPQTAVGSNAGYKQFVHTVSFNYTAGSNLAVFVEYTQTTAQATNIYWQYEYVGPCVNTSNSNTTKYENTTGAFTGALPSSNYRRPFIAFDVASTTAPGCTTITSPTAGATNVVNGNALAWNAVAFVTGYKVFIGTTPGGSDVVNGTNVGNVTTYALAGLSPSTTYYARVVPTNAIGDATGCTEISFATPAIPANDECSNAVALTVNSNDVCATGSSAAGNTLGATESLAATPCTGVSNDDVWYSFVATSPSHVITLSNIVSTGVTSTTDMYFQVLSGSCGALTSVLCSDPNANMVTGLTVGQTYYVRVYTVAVAGASASFTICVTTPPPPPANDNCVNAVTLVPSNTSLCASPVSGTTLSATDSGVAIAPCTGTADDDVWYSFVATSTAHTVLIYNVVSVGTTSSTSLYLQVMSGSCGTLSSVTCDTSYTTPTVLTGLTVGQTYYVRVYNSVAGSAAANTFSICIITPTTPLNDECSTATSLTVSGTSTCTSAISGSTLNATDSGIAVAPCTGTPNDDVWYSFVAANSSHIVTLSNVVSVGTTSSTALSLQVFSGACGTLASMLCDTSSVSSASLNGLTPGQTYYIRVYNANGAGYANNFNICITTPAALPANDACSGAINAVTTVLTPYVNTQDASGATNNAGFVSCGTAIMNDGVWYTLIGDGSTITVDVTNVGAWDPEIGIYSGSCGSLSCIINKDAGAAGASETASFATTIGVIYYINIGQYNPTVDELEGNYTITVSTNGIILGTVNAASKDEVKMYPNPFGDVVYISDIKNVKYVIITDVSGRKVKTVNKPDKEINLIDLKAGLYILTLHYNDGSLKSFKAIKK
ncbi:T9SS type A sorting domain-containing protein [Chryseobacterium sp.]|uniref:T9SS type A sorting domain-containing protein n=1 Tax=Chryseobacterium sp. TaxID=1871047 RepID=UPI0011CAB346|nr:T9SS type A sorting domain-containing protein [Chryseobacterium sp.]TXF77636.1 T9SS type A sorting domain-containing protein [Chryseobacterium sp.]